MVISGLYQLKRPRTEDIKFSMPTEILTNNKSQMLKNNDFSCAKTLRCCIYPANKC